MKSLSATQCICQHLMAHPTAKPQKYFAKRPSPSPLLCCLLFLSHSLKHTVTQKHTLSLSLVFRSIATTTMYVRCKTRKRGANVPVKTAVSLHPRHRIGNKPLLTHRPVQHCSGDGARRHLPRRGQRKILGPEPVHLRPPVQVLLHHKNHSKKP